jgi:Holliday junction resolvase RusA-like endonuclease
MKKLADFRVKVEPRPLQRHRKARYGNQYDPSAEDKRKLCLLSTQYAPNKPFDCALMVNYVFGFKRPKSHYRTGKFKNILKDSAPLHHIQKPDKSNLEKLVEDAFNGLFWKDDSCICLGKSMKIWTEFEAFTSVEIVKL